MDNELYEEQEAPFGIVTAINFSVLTETDKEKISVISIDAVNEVTNPQLGLPNPSNQCPTCGAKDSKSCEGHCGVIKFPFAVLHPYYLSEVAQILNKVCPRCKSIRKDLQVKVRELLLGEKEGCQYCTPNPYRWYPPMKFKVSSQDLFKKTTIVVEVIDKQPTRFNRRRVRAGLPEDYWDFIPKDEQQDESSIKPNKRVLTHAQVHHLLKDVDPQLIMRYVPRVDLLFLNCFPVTPNSHRVTEFMHAFSGGQRLVFDDRTRAYKKLVDFRGKSNELGSYVVDCLKVSKLGPDKSSSKESVFTEQIKFKDTATQSAGLRWIKDVVLGKRSNNCFRMVVTGNPNLKVSEIGIPCNIAERMQISENLNTWNWEKLNASCDIRLLEKGEIYVRRKDSMVRIRRTDDLQIGDTVFRPLHDGDILLINRPPSIHQHSLIALSVKVLPITFVVSLNPICCSPFRGDFDGDCFHGYVPQSIGSRAELSELVALDKQLINRQSGRNILSLNQDSLIATYLVMEDGVFMDHFQMQQLQMFCDRQLPAPAIIKAPELESCFWTGKQLFSMLLPPNFSYNFPDNGVCIHNGEVISCSEGVDWLRAGGNIFQSLVEHFRDNVLDFLYTAQEVLCEWLSMRGLSVSLSDLYLSSDPYSRENMIDDIFYGLREADQTCNFKQLMLYSNQEFLAGEDENYDNTMASEVEYLCYEKQKSAALSQASVDAFKQVFRDIQGLVFKHASKDNSLIAMFKAGSKGNLLRIVQHSMCLGVQHSLIPLSFRVPHKLSCAEWNKQKSQDIIECARTFIPYAVIENSFLTGLNPLECFVHSVTNRDSSFSDNAELPGTLHRKLMFFMRDLHYAYDGTVRNGYGNQLVQFSYCMDDCASASSGSTHGDSVNAFDELVGQPVGASSASAFSEAAYSALDQPVSVLESSPLLNLKSVLECGSKKGGHRTVSLYLSKELGKRRHGFEYGALEVKNHLERVLFSDIVSTFMITFSQQISHTHVSPWVCHFNVHKEVLKRRRIKVHSIIDALCKKLNSTRTDSKTILPNCHITSKDCSYESMLKEDNDTCCITVEIIKNPKDCSLETVRDLVIPFFLGTVIRGFAGIKKVDILWKDLSNQSKHRFGSSGELYLRVSMSDDCNKKRYWSALVDNCLQITNMIDWTRSHPDNVKDFCLAYGIGAGWKYFLNSLDSAISDIGKNILPQHSLLLADCLSTTGEFVGLNGKGLARQQKLGSVSSPFMQACFSIPGQSFIKAAKSQIVDGLQGSLDALAWGKVPSVGTGGEFDIIYSGKGLELANPVDIYNLLGSESLKQSVKIEVPKPWKRVSDKDGAKFSHTKAVSTLKGREQLGSMSKAFLRNSWTLNDIQKLGQTLRSILHKYPIDQRLSDADKTTLMKALYFHPRKEEKIGSGAANIKVGHHSKYKSTKCFILEREDGTDEDFSYHKCIHSAMEIIAPRKAKGYQSKWLQHVAAE